MIGAAIGTVDTPEQRAFLGVQTRTTRTLLEHVAPPAEHKWKELWAKDWLASVGTLEVVEGPLGVEMLHLDQIDCGFIKYYPAVQDLVVRLAAIIEVKLQITRKVHLEHRLAGCINLEQIKRSVDQICEDIGLAIKLDKAQHRLGQRFGALRSAQSTSAVLRSSSVVFDGPPLAEDAIADAVKLLAISSSSPSTSLTAGGSNPAAIDNSDLLSSAPRVAQLVSVRLNQTSLPSDFATMCMLATSDDFARWFLVQAQGESLAVAARSEMRRREQLEIQARKRQEIGTTIAGAIGIGQCIQCLRKDASNSTQKERFELQIDAYVTCGQWRIHICDNTKDAHANAVRDHVIKGLPTAQRHGLAARIGPNSTSQDPTVVAAGLTSGNMNIVPPLTSTSECSLRSARLLMPDLILTTRKLVRPGNALRLDENGKVALPARIVAQRRYSLPRPLPLSAGPTSTGSVSAATGPPTEPSLGGHPTGSSSATSPVLNTNAAPLESVIAPHLVDGPWTMLRKIEREALDALRARDEREATLKQADMDDGSRLLAVINARLDESAFPHPPLKREGVVFSTIKACEETRAFLLHLVDKPFIEPPSTPATPIVTGDPLNNRDAPANELSESSDGLARFYARFVTFESLKHALDFMRRYASDHYTNLAWASTIISGLLSLKAKELGHASDVALSYSGYTIANSISGRLVDDLAIEQLSLPLVDRSQPTWPEVEDDSRLSSQPFLVSTPSVPQRTRARKTSTNPPCLNAVRLTLSSRFSTPSGVTLSTCSHSGSRKSIRQRQAIQLMSVPKVDVRLLLPSSRQRRAFCGEAYSPQRRMLPPTSLSSAKALLAPRLSVARLSLVLVQVGAVTPATLSHVTCCKSRSTRYSCCKTYRPRGSKLPRNGRLARRWTCSLYLQSQETVNQALYSNQRVEVTWREEEGKEEVEQTSTSPDAGVE